jgi:hypothetical protein
MLERNTDNAVTGVLIHELAHQYGAPDHYHEFVNGICVGGNYCAHILCSDVANSPRPTWCIMNIGRPANIAQIPASSVFCTGCTDDMIRHLNIFNSD